MRRLLVATMVALALFVPSTARAGDDWLVNPPTNWNVPGMSVPTTSEAGYNLDYCTRSVRTADTATDRQVQDAGWTLWGPYEGGWGINIVRGTVGFDGMCRPSGYQFFVFQNGQFVGTISPTPMEARSSGSGNINQLYTPEISANFVRYADTDPLCCPSRPGAHVEYRIDDTFYGPVLVPVSVTDTTPAS